MNMNGFSERQKPPTQSLDAYNISRQGIQKFLAPKIKGIFPQGSRTLWGVIFPQIKVLIENAGLNMRSKDERDVFLGILAELVPEGEGDKELKRMISAWLPPQ